MNLFSPFNESQRAKEKKYQMAKFICLIIGIQGLIMSLISFIEGSHSMMIISLSYAVLMFLVFFHTIYTKNLLIFFVTTIILVLYLEINFMFLGGTEGFGIIWLLIIPAFSVYLFNDRGFYHVNFLYLGILIAGFWTPLKQYLYDFKPSFMLRFPMVYGLEFIFCIFLKYRITKTERELEHQKEILDKEIQQAALIQKAFLQMEPKYYEHWSLAYKNKPMSGVSGDLFDVFSKDNNLQGLGIFDISGHGVSSGMITMLIRKIYQYFFYSDTESELWETVQKINDSFIFEKGGVQNYLTGILLRIKDNEIEMVNAGHAAPVIYRKETDSFEIIERDPRAVGAIGLQHVTSMYYSQLLQMQSGDELFLYTDGLVDCVNKDKEAFGMERLLGTFQKYIKTTVEDQINLSLADVDLFRGTVPQNDDISLMILKRD